MERDARFPVGIRNRFRLILFLLQLCLCLLAVRGGHQIWYQFMRHRSRTLRLMARAIRLEFSGTGVATRITTALYPKPGYAKTEFGKIVWEAPFAVTIWSEEGPLCGMSLELRPHMICIHQLQGVAGAKLFDLPDWPERFVRACIRFARRAGIRYVRVYNADQRLFYHYPELPETEEAYFQARERLQARLRSRYEGTAAKMGLVPKQFWGEWEHPKWARSS